MLIYGTAWKEEETARLVGLALKQGFRAFDTANQRKHYHEAGVGEALAAFGLPREEVFLQTKFTHPGGQDERVPYALDASPADQVHQSFASSLSHLGVTYVDSLVLHGPRSRTSWEAADRETWAAMEEISASGGAKLLGISNVSLEMLIELCEWAAMPPMFVQNRCYAKAGWDRDVREFCADHGLIYQGFSLLNGNRDVLTSKVLAGIAARLDVTVEQVVFRFALQVGMYPLTGTTSAEHMAQDLAVESFKLSPADMRAVEGVAG